MKLKIFIIALSAILLLSLAACTSNGNEGDGTSETTAGVFEPDLAALREKMITDFQATDAINVETEMLLNLYGIAAEDVAECAAYMTMDGVFPQEVVMIRATDAAAASRIEAALNTRIAEVKNQSQSYDPENYALAQKCRVALRDTYVTMFLSPHFDEMTALFNGTK